MQAACAHRAACLARPLELPRRAFVYQLDPAARDVHRCRDAVETVTAVRRGAVARPRGGFVLVLLQGAFLAERLVCLDLVLTVHPGAKDIVGQLAERQAAACRERPPQDAELREPLDAQERRLEPRVEREP